MKYLFSILLFLVGVAAQAATYYVSSSQGSDSAAGTSTGACWAHHPWDQLATGTSDGTTLAAGDVVVMYGGDSWWNCYLVPTSSGDAGNPITTTTNGSWGSGMAVLSAALSPASLTWISDGGNVYHVTNISTIPKVVVYNQTTQLSLNAGATTGVTLNQYDTGAGNGGTVWVNVGGDPGATIQLSKQNYVINTTSKNNLTFKGLNCQCPQAQFGVIYYNASTNITCDTVWAQFVWSANGRGVYINNSSGAMFLNGLVNGGTNGYQGIAIAGTTGTIISNSVFNGWITGLYFDTGATYSSIVSNTIGGILNASYGVTCAQVTNTFTGNTITNCATGLNVYGNGCVMNYNSIGWCTNNGIAVAAGGGLQIIGNSIWSNAVGLYPNQYGIGLNVYGSASGCLVSGNRLFYNSRGWNHVATTGSGNNVFQYNLCYNQTVNGGDNEGDPNANFIQFNNNTVWHSPNSGNTPPYTGHGLCDQLAASKRTQYANNIIAVTPDLTATNCQALAIAQAPTYIQADYQLYFDVNGAGITIGALYGNLFTNLATWQTACATAPTNSIVKDLAGASKAETNSLFTDPKFVNSGASDYQLGYLSPAIDSAYELSQTNDALGNPIYGTPDRGCFEYQPPYTVGVTSIDSSGGARIYKDGKFRSMFSTNGTMASLALQPSGGFTSYTISQRRPEWMNVTNVSWRPLPARWSFSAYSTNETGTVVATISSLPAGNNVVVREGGVVITNRIAEVGNTIAFSYANPDATVRSFTIDYGPTLNPGFLP